MIVKYAFVLYDVEIAYDSSFDYNVNVICIWLCTSKVIWNLDFLEVFFKTWIGIADLFYIGNVTQKNLKLLNIIYYPQYSIYCTKVSHISG